ncbi:MAG TPA: DUF3024 domain-containing protein [Malonomonas sp.]
MNLPQLLQRQAVKLLDRFCSDAAAHQLQPRQLRYQIEGRQIHLFEIRCPRHTSDQQQERPLAQLRYSPELNQWTLHHQNGRHWQLYLNINPSLDLGKLLVAIQQDPLSCFWQK